MSEPPERRPDTRALPPGGEGGGLVQGSGRRPRRTAHSTWNSPAQQLPEIQTMRVGGARPADQSRPERILQHLVRERDEKDPIKHDGDGD
jgi:hypothetical protein